jgi:two-component system osmolarity sensor histidine kinase EnvZ
VARGPVESHDSSPVPLEAAGPAPARVRGPGWSLFWRTFFLLAALLLVSILAWLQTLRAFELDPRAVQAAQQIASLVNLSRAALIHSDSIARVSLIKTMTDQEGVRILPREPTDRFEPFEDDALGGRISQELESRLGPGTVVANSVNGEPGLWVGFTIEDDGYWMFTDRSRLNPPVGKTWIIWLVIAAALSLAGAALIARLINRPLKDLSVAATRVREGDFAASELNETMATSEIRDVNMEFNRMSRKLVQIEQDRAIMLAGISHDLRTPLARLRLETELSVADIDAREHMASDISQVNAIIDKFMDYARPDHIVLAPVALGEVVERCVYALKDRSDMRFTVDLPNDLRVQADEVELSRVVSNLLENAARYGKSADTGVAQVDISAKPRDAWVLLEVRDHGPGVAPHNLEHLTKAFFRGDAARTSATGAGLGLAIVEKNIQRMGGAFALVNRSSGGLAARIQLQRVT